MIRKAVVGPELAGTRLDDGAKTLFPQLSKARTAFRVLSTGGRGTLLEARPLTGRTHQVRVHLAHCGFPVIGDDRYAEAPATRMMLHCRHMAFRAWDGRRVAATAPVGAAFREACAHAGGVMEQGI